MKLLIDTNIFIKVEPTGLAPLEADAPEAIRLLGLAASANCEIYLHPLQRKDIESDANEERKKLRHLLTGKYRFLPASPPLGTINKILGDTSPSSNHWIDHHLLAALRADAVDFLVTEDVRLRKKARQLGLGERAETLSGINEILGQLLDRPIRLPSPIEKVTAYEIDEKDPFFDSLRSDYKLFDRWFVDKCKKEHREAWIQRKPDRSGLGAICIIKRENKWKGVDEKILKICTFKVDQSLGGIRLGELLLWNVITFAMQNAFSKVYVTAFPKHEHIIDFFQDFGFYYEGLRENGEALLVKELDPKTELIVDPWKFHLKYGPQRLRLQGEPTFIVPIQPQYHKMLFPDLEAQGDFVTAHSAHGNAIRKAYLCHSPIGRIQKGDVLSFYRSEDRKSIYVVGIAEGTIRFSDPDEIVRFTGKRSVYTQRDIEEMSKKEILAILFRKALVLTNPISLDELISSKSLSAAPQSIQEVSQEATLWLHKRMAE